MKKRQPRQAAAKEAPRAAHIKLAGRRVPLRFRRNPRARRVILCIDLDGVVVTLPRGVPAIKGLDFASERAEWIRERLDRIPPRVPFADGAIVPVLGVPHRIRHMPRARGVVTRTKGELRVSGAIEHLERRVRDWLRAEARRHIVRRVAAKAARLGTDHGRITLRDTRSRWGSCSADGNLSFCWRLVMTPPRVLDYVVAHEVAHLRVRDHGARFWRTVAELVDGVERAREWLRRNGETLHRYG